MFSDWDKNTQQFKLFREAITNHLVCIMTHGRRSIGSGVLVRRGGKTFVVTAAHVIGGANPEEVELFLRLPGLLAEAGSGVAPRPGTQVHWKVVRRLRSPPNDLAALEVEAATPPAPAEFYDLTSAGPVTLNDRTSLVYCGFPTSAGVPLGRKIRAVPVCDDHTCYDPGLLSRSSANIRVTDHNPRAQLLVPYLRYHEGIEPHGFSGAGLWANREHAQSPIWRPRATLVGIIVGYIRAIHALNATALPAVLSLVDVA